MKPKRTDEEPSMVVRETPPIYGAQVSSATGETGMVRTQIYLTTSEHAFLQQEAARTGGTMASMIRGFIDEKMELPDQVWAKNSLLDPPVSDPTFTGQGDEAINHDHYIYGAPKRYKKVRGKWGEQPLTEQ